MKRVYYNAGVGATKRPAFDDVKGSFDIMYKGILEESYAPATLVWTQTPIPQVFVAAF